MSEIRGLMRLALPVIAVQVGLMLMGVVDTMMVGRLSAEALAAVALGHLYVFVTVIFGLGVLMALDPVVSQAVGARDAEGIARGVQRGLVATLLVTAPCSFILLPARELLTLLRQPPEVIHIASEYAWVSIPGVFPFLLFAVFRQTLQAMGRMAPIVTTILAANALNAFLNWVLIFGHLGMPALGAVGSGWASTISRGFMAIVILAASWRVLRPSLIPIRREIFEVAPFLRMMRIGVPIGTQMVLELGAFATIGLLMGWLGPREMAGHQVALNIASLTFMVPLGISMAAAVQVGHAIGRSDMAAARRSARASLMCATGFMTCTALLFVYGATPISRIYTDQASVIGISILLIPIAGVFQIFDGLQVVSGGVLRGLGDTRVPMLINILGFWLVGMPVSLYLAFERNVGPAGLWWGLVAGLGAVAVLLMSRAALHLRREVSRVVIDKPLKETVDA